MFDKILVPLDRSPLAECVLPHAIALARCLDAQVMLLHVLSRPDKQDRLRAVDPLEWQLRRAEAESYLQDVCLRVREAGVACEAQVNNGDAAEQIVDCARADEIGLVLIASHGQGGLSDWNLSSVIQKVIVRASTSLMIVPRGSAGAGRHRQPALSAGVSAFGQLGACRMRAPPGRRPDPRPGYPDPTDARGAAPTDAQAHATQPGGHRIGRSHRGAQPDRGRTVS